jgi:hypothetical protein
MKLNMLLFPEKRALEKDVKKYNNLQDLEVMSGGSIGNNLSSTQRTRLAGYIHYNYDKMDDAEKKQMVMKLLDEDTVKSFLLTFEFTYYDYKKRDMTLDEFITKATYIFDRYQTRVCGSAIEDTKWIVHRTDSPYFSVRGNEIVFQNTIDNIDINDCSLKKYLNTLVHKLNGLSVNIEVELEFIEKKKLSYVLIWAIDITLKDENIVGL